MSRPQPSGESPGSYGPPARLGHAVELVVGGLFGALLAVASGLLGLALMGTTENGAVFFIGPLLGLAVAVVVTYRPATRWWGLGMLCGFFLALIVLGGACVALIVSFGG